MTIHHARDPDIISGVFRELSDEFVRAMTYHGMMNREDLEQLAVAGRLGTLVAIVENQIMGAAVYEFQLYPRARALNVVALAGKKGTFGKWSHDIVAELVKLCDTYGCSHLVAEGRIGWLTVARKLGFRTVKRAVLIKGITVHEQGWQRDHEHDPKQHALESAGPAVSAAH